MMIKEKNMILTIKELRDILEKVHNQNKTIVILDGTNLSNLLKKYIDKPKEVIWNNIKENKI